MDFIYDLNKLLPGDIILKRTPGDEISERVMNSTHSDYSHAMLYLGDSSYIDVGHRVQARNLQRYVFNDRKNTCLLRLKKELWDSEIVCKAIAYARSVVANPYSIRDALNLEEGRVFSYTENTQICTRLVTKSYEYAGLKIVDNIEMCTPQEILNSSCLSIIDNCIREATLLDVKFSKSYDVIDDMVKSTDKLINLMSIYNNGTLRSVEAITNYAINHPRDDEKIADLLKLSGYLDVLDLDREHNTHHYNPIAFVEYYKEESRVAALQQIDFNVRKVEMYESEISKYHMIQSLLNFKSRYLELQIELYERIINSYRQRAFVGMLVLHNFV